MQVAVLGSLNMDLVVRTERVPRPGETVHGEGFRMIPGGKGANQAAATARLGVEVEMLGRVGNDSFADQMLNNMRNQGVGIDHIIRDTDAASGTAMIMVQADGDNSIIVAPGANGRVSVEDVDAVEQTIAQARYLVMQFEVPLPVVRRAIKLADQAGVRVILNPAPAYSVDAEFLLGVHCLVVNETEAETLTGISVNDLDRACRAAQELRDMQIPVVIVTLGAQGALVLSDEGPVHVPAQPVEVVDTTVDGDAFIGGVVAARLRSYDLIDAVRYATCAGSLATTVLGAQTSLPGKEQVDAFYREVYC